MYFCSYGIFVKTSYKLGFCSSHRFIKLKLIKIVRNIYHSILLKDESHFLLLIYWNYKYNNSKNNFMWSFETDPYSSLEFWHNTNCIFIKRKKRLDYKCRSSRWHCTYKNFKDGTHLLWSNLAKTNLCSKHLCVDRYIKSACSMTHASRDFVHNYTEEILLETHRKKYKLMDTKEQQPRGLNFKQLYV